MRVRLVMRIRGQTVAKRTIASAYALNQPLRHQKIQYTVDGNPVDLPDPVQLFDNFLCT
jgi:hypothetical protein